MADVFPKITVQAWMRKDAQTLGKESKMKKKKKEKTLFYEATKSKPCRKVFARSEFDVFLINNCYLFFFPWVFLLS